jgi:hypothetical protein
MPRAAIAAVPSDQAFLTHHLQFLTFSQAMVPFSSYSFSLSFE